MATTTHRRTPDPVPDAQAVSVRGCRVHNLRNIDFEIPYNKLTVVTGVSGSGKSSLAFDTLYAEGQRRYVESMSAYARQFLERMEKPDADEITGIAPSIAIRQKNSTRNPRSTVGTTTEIYDYLRLLYARIGETFCSQCGGRVRKDTVDEVADRLLDIAAKAATVAKVSKTAKTAAPAKAVLPPKTAKAAKATKPAQATKDALPAAAAPAPSGLRAYILFPLLRAGIDTAAVEQASGPPASSSKTSKRKTAAKKKAAKVPDASDTAPAPPGTFPLTETIKSRLFELRKLGFNRLYQAGEIFEFSTPESLLEIDFRKPVWMLADRMSIAPDNRQRLIDSLELCYREGGEAVIEFPDVASSPALKKPGPALKKAGVPATIAFNDRFECKTCRLAYTEPEPHLFSFNSPYGACPRCQGFGNTIDFDQNLVIPDPTLSLEEGAIVPWTKPRYRVFYNEFRKLAREHGFPLDVPYFRLSEEEKEFVWNARIEGKRGRRAWVGLNGFFDYLERKKYKLHVRVFLSRYRGYALCPECQGGRLRPEAYLVRVGGQDLRAVCRMSIEKVREFFDTITLGPAQEFIAGKILDEVRQRLLYLENVGLEYLTLDRLTSTLSGGEAQRIQLAASIGSHLVGALYVLDEPSIGLHSRDTNRLIRILEELRDQGNTIVVVEHDPAMMAAADHILDLGPGAGKNGGNVQFAGTLPELLGGNTTLTGRYLRGDLRISLPTARRPVVPARQLKIHGAFAHNLKNLDVSIPLGMMVAVTGVSGSGKSSLVHDVLYNGLRATASESLRNPEPDSEEELELGRRLNCHRLEGAEHVRRVVLVDQSPIGRTPRSNPVTYVKAFDPIRELFSSQPEARRSGYAPGFFSFNIPGGRCETCQGNGTVTVEMQFLADVELICEDCQGMRFKPGVLGVSYRGKNIHEVLRLTIREAIGFFSSSSTVVNRLRLLDQVGLGYLHLGQSATTLSGGEAQRIKLAAHLTTRDIEDTLYLFDEPTTGLHFDDIAKLLAAFQKLLARGASITIIEHNLEVIKTADWVIELGPEGGDGGGQLVCAGTPEQVAGVPGSHTAGFLGKVLERHLQWGEAIPTP